MTEEYIDLQSAHVTQLTENSVKGEWFVKKNKTGDLLWTFPATIGDPEMFSIMDFVRKYELIAFNAGINFQKGKQNEVLKSTIDKLKSVNKELGEENQRLANVVEILTNNGG